jgi:aspartyl-tRNA synthetase
MSKYRTHTCGELRANDCLAEVRLSGWIHRRRDHGGLMFIDLRDNYGITQLVLHPETPGFDVMDRLRAESVVRIDGQVVDRLKGTINANLATGEIEIRVSGVEVLSEAAELPVPVFGEPDYPEELRLKHRYLDLRRDTLHKNIELRSDVIAHLRDEMRAQGFKEFQTPILTASSPEGARDFLVPSRLHPGQFYALPQAPQQFKQLLMVSGFDRYFQIAPCFRDEAGRADRSPGEFYQLDVEMSFVEQEDVLSMIEPVLYSTFIRFRKNAFRNKEGVKETTENCPVSSYPFVRIPYRDSIRRFGTDKPDLRNPLEFVDVSEVFKGSDFKVFANILETPGNAVWGIFAPNISSKFARDMNDWAIEQGQAGLAAIYPTLNGHAGPVVKAIGTHGEPRMEALKNLIGFNPEDGVFFVAGNPDEFYKFAGALRTKLGEELGSYLGIDKNRFEFCWIVDFPMYELNDEGKIDFSHNPFSMPQGEMEALETKNPLDILAYQYDIVCNGIELCSGGIRNHKPEIMLKAFEIAGYGPEVVEDKFGGMLNAFRYGAPPHGGLAPGIDRIVMLLAGVDTIREVIAFPLNQQGQDLMMNAPSAVSEKQLKELNIRPAIK